MKQTPNIKVILKTQDLSKYHNCLHFTEILSFQDDFDIRSLFYLIFLQIVGWRWILVEPPKDMLNYNITRVWINLRLTR